MTKEESLLRVGVGYRGGGALVVEGKAAGKAKRRVGVSQLA